MSWFLNVKILTRFSIRLLFYFCLNDKKLAFTQVISSLSNLELLWKWNEKTWDFMTSRDFWTQPVTYCSCLTEINDNIKINFFFSKSNTLKVATKMNLNNESKHQYLHQCLTLIHHKFLYYILDVAGWFSRENLLHSRASLQRKLGLATTCMVWNTLSINGYR